MVKSLKVYKNVQTAYHLQDVWYNNLACSLVSWTFTICKTQDDHEFQQSVRVCLMTKHIPIGFLDMISAVYSVYTICRQRSCLLWLLKVVTHFPSDNSHCGVVPCSLHITPLLPPSLGFFYPCSLLIFLCSPFIFLCSMPLFNFFNAPWFFCMCSLWRG